MTRDTRPHALADDDSVRDHGAYLPELREGVAKQLADIDRAGTTDAASIQGRPIVVLTMRGARSRMLRRVPLMRVEHEGRYLAVASKGGAPEHPSWFYNLRAHTDVLVQDGGVQHPCRARLLEEGPERQQWWDRAVEAFPPYADYQASTGRTIPLFVLEPTT
jgi:F420H(2)-dependent quinone reductase